MATTNEAQAILGAGKVSLNLFNPVTRAFEGWGDQLEADRFEITPDSEVKEKISKSREAYGQAIASIPLAKPTKLVLIISGANKAAMALQFQGVLSTYSQGAGAIAEDVVAKLDKWVSLTKRNIESAAFAVNLKAAPQTVYALGTDYVVDYAAGAIKVLESGAIAANAELHVTGQAAAVSGTRIRGGTQTRVRCGAKFVGVNLVDESPMTAEVYEVQLRSTQGFDFLADDFNGIQLEGTMVKPADKDEAYIVDMDSPPAA
jgi:hypothetical protein